MIKTFNKNVTDKKVNDFIKQYPDSKIVSYDPIRVEYEKCIEQRVEHETPYRVLKCQRPLKLKFWLNQPEFLQAHEQCACCKDGNKGNCDSSKCGIDVNSLQFQDKFLNCVEVHFYSSNKILFIENINKVFEFSIVDNYGYIVDPDGITYLAIMINGSKIAPAEGEHNNTKASEIPDIILDDLLSKNWIDKDPDFLYYHRTSTFEEMGEKISSSIQLAGYKVARATLVSGAMQAESTQRVADETRRRSTPVIIRSYY